MRTLLHRAAVPLAVILLASPEIAWAYIGPGAGITAIGSAIALLGSILLVIVGFVWYPIKRLMAKMKNRKHQASEQEPDPPL